MEHLTSSPAWPSILASIDQWLAYQVYIRELPGISAAIAVGTETVFHRQFGYADLEAVRPFAPDTLFRIASQSKLFTATAIMRLCARGQLKLDDRAADYLHWFRSANNPRFEQITLRQLLTHSSGVVRDGNTRHWTFDEAFPDQDSIRMQARQGISVFETSVHWKYSNFGFALLGQVLEAVMKTTYAEAVMQLVVLPLELQNTFPEFSEELRQRHATGYGLKYLGEKRMPLSHRSARAMGSATGFSSTAADLVRFYQAHLFGDPTLLEESGKREMQRVQFKDGDYEWGLGFGLNNIGEGVYASHGGRYPGFRSFSGLNQASRRVIVVLTNAVDGPARELFQGISKWMDLASDAPERFRAVPQSEAEELDAVAGFYQSHWGIDGYQRIGEKLVGFDPALLDPASELDIYERVGPLTYRKPIRNRFSAVGEEIRFLPDDTGSITRVLYPAGSAVRWKIPAGP